MRGQGQGRVEDTVEPSGLSSPSLKAISGARDRDSRDPAGPLEPRVGQACSGTSVRPSRRQVGSGDPRVQEREFRGQEAGRGALQVKREHEIAMGVSAEKCVDITKYL